MTAARRLSSNFGLQAFLLLLAAAVGALGGVNPLYGVGAAVGLAFVGFVLSDLTVGICVFTVVSFLELLPTSGTLSFSKFTGLLLVVAWLGKVAGRKGSAKGFVAAHPTITYVILFFLGWSLLTYLWAESPTRVLGDWYRYALNFFLLPIVYAAVRRHRHVIWVLAAFVVGSVFSALFGMFSSSGTAAEANVTRATGTIGEANTLAALLVAGFIFAAVLAILSRRSPAARVGAAAASVLCIYGLFLTLSRGGLIALGAALIAAVVFGGRWRPAITAFAATTALVVVGYFALIAPAGALERVTTAEGGSGRSDIWTIAWRMVQAHPVNGVGLGNFQTSSIHYLIKPGLVVRSDLITDTPEVAHNMYLHILAETGIIGLLAFMCILGFALVCAVKAARQFGRSGDARMELVSRAVLVALVGILVSDFFLSNQFVKQLWLLIALCPALLAIAHVHAERMAPELLEERLRPRRGHAARPALAWQFATGGPRPR